MIHPDTEIRFVRPEIGVGVFATRFIPRGTITWVPDQLDSRFTPAQFTAMPRLMQEYVDRYSFVDSTGSYVLCWDHARYMNHNCRPNVRGLGELVDIAVRDIHPGEELTCEYAGFNLASSLRCMCGETCCRQMILTGDLWQWFSEWDAEVAVAAANVGSVSQPILHLASLPASGVRLLEGLAKSERLELPSIRTSWCPTVIREDTSGLSQTGT